MAKFVFGLNMSLDGYIDHQAFAPERTLFRHFIQQVREAAGMVYGRRMYEVMRYWDDDTHEWDADEREYAMAWRSKPKWVVSHSLSSVGPNATLVADGVEAAMRKLKADLAATSTSLDRSWRKAWVTSGSSTNIGFTSTPSCLATASPSSRGRDRRCALSPATRSTRT